MTESALSKTSQALPVGTFSRSGFKAWRPPSVAALRFPAQKIQKTQNFFEEPLDKSGGVLLY
jgi:hypothetical protein